MLKNPKIAIICAKWGTRYGSGYANALYRAVQDNLSYQFDFVCLTDSFDGLSRGIHAKPLVFEHMDKVDWGSGMWPKLRMFDHDVSGGYDIAVFLDLDVVITGSLDPIIDLALKRGGLHLVPKFRGFAWKLIPGWIWDRIPAVTARITRGNSSVVVFRPDEQAHLLANFKPEQHLQSHKNDQDYISDFATRRRCLPKNWCVEMRNLVPRWPLNLVYKPYLHTPRAACVVIFNGRPNPHELADPDIGAWGWKGKRCHGPVAWVRDYLRTYGLS